MSRVWPARRSSPVVSEPYAVCKVSGIAPRVSQGSSEWNGMTWERGTRVYSA